MIIPQSTPPRPDEIEVSVFGPGFGESVLAHVGRGEWILVDSCVEGAQKISKPIEYLRSIGQNPEECVRVVVATHWHDDHVKGLADALEICEKAIFCCSSALTKGDFLNLAELYQEDVPEGFPPGPAEIRRAIEIAAIRSQKQKQQMLKFAKADSLLWASNAVRLVALSPSDEMNRRALEFMASAYADAASGRDIDRLTPGIPNDTAVVLRLDIANRSILLGSDLEAGQNPLVGWSAVLATNMAPEKKSSVFKVAHHGSKSGWHANVWSDMLDPRPFALMSPFRWGRHRLPTANDRARLSAETDKAYITADPDTPAPSLPRKRDPKVEGSIAETTMIRRATSPVGHVRWRAAMNDLNDDGQVALFDGAIKLV